MRDLLAHLETSGRLFSQPGRPLSARECREAITGGQPARPREQRFGIASDTDVLVVQRATQTLTRGFFGTTDCVRLATATSEFARNIYMYAKLGQMTLRLSESLSDWVFELEAVDQGPGIPNLELIMKGQYRSRTGLGRGIVGTKALLDELLIDTGPGKGTRVHGTRRTRKT